MNQASESESLSPLDAGEIDRVEALESDAERFWARIPVLGWGIAGSMWKKRFRPVRAAYFRRLAARPEGCLDTWGESRERRDLAKAIGEIAKKEMGWPNARFVPEDPYRVVFWSFDDGLDLEMAMEAIEERFGVDVLEERDVLRWSEGDLGTFVDDILERIARAGEHPATTN